MKSATNLAKQQMLAYSIERIGTTTRSAALQTSDLFNNVFSCVPQCRYVFLSAVSPTTSTGGAAGLLRTNRGTQAKEERNCQLSKNLSETFRGDCGHPSEARLHQVAGPGRRRARAAGRAARGSRGGGLFHRRDMFDKAKTCENGNPKVQGQVEIWRSGLTNQVVDSGEEPYLCRPIALAHRHRSGSCCRPQSYHLPFHLQDLGLFQARRGGFGLLLASLQDHFTKRHPP